MTLSLEHRAPECTGSWVPGPEPTHGYPDPWPQHWRCGSCGAVYYHSPEVMEAVEAEHEAGAILDVLTRGDAHE